MRGERVRVIAILGEERREGERERERERDTNKHTQHAHAHASIALLCVFHTLYTICALLRTRFVSFFFFFVFSHYHLTDEGIARWLHGDCMGIALHVRWYMDA